MGIIQRLKAIFTSRTTIGVPTQSKHFSTDISSWDLTKAVNPLNSMPQPKQFSTDISDWDLTKTLSW